MNQEAIQFNGTFTISVKNFFFLQLIYREGGTVYTACRVCSALETENVADFKCGRQRGRLWLHGCLCVEEMDVDQIQDVNKTALKTLFCQGQNSGLANTH